MNEFYVETQCIFFSENKYSGYFSDMSISEGWWKLDNENELSWELCLELNRYGRDQNGCLKQWELEKWSDILHFYMGSK